MSLCRTATLKYPEREVDERVCGRKTEGDKKMEDQKAKDNCLSPGSPVKILS